MNRRRAERGQPVTPPKEKCESISFPVLSDDVIGRYQPCQKALNQIDAEVALKACVVPLKFRGRGSKTQLVVATSKPNQRDFLDQLALDICVPLQVCVASESAVTKMINRVYNLKLRLSNEVDFFEGLENLSQEPVYSPEDFEHTEAFEAPSEILVRDPEDELELDPAATIFDFKHDITEPLNEQDLKMIRAEFSRLS